MVKYFAIPVLFALVVAVYVMVSGKHNQASWTGLMIFNLLFYGAPYFLHSVLMWLFKASNQLIHAGFIGINAKDQMVLLGHDHEYSDTYYGAAAQYFDEPETDLLQGAPSWWGFDLDPLPFEWIGFVYGWDGKRWQRADYDKDDGFTGINLLGACSITDFELLREYCLDAPGLNGQPPSDEALRALVAADGKLSRELLEAAIPGWDLDAGMAAAAKFLQASV